MRDTNPQPSVKPRAEKQNLYDEITSRIVAELEAGRVPWVQPWGGANAALGLPKNVATARRDKLNITLVASGLLSLVALYGGVMLLLTTSIYTKLGI